MEELVLDAAATFVFMPAARERRKISAYERRHMPHGTFPRGNERAQSRP
jgi:hypothetical protein